MSAVIGIHPVLEALKARSGRLERILMQQGRRGPALSEVLEQARKRGVPVRFQPRPALDRASGGQVHQGVVALAGPFVYAEEGAVLEAAGKTAFLVVLDRIEDPRNLGAVIRTAAAAGAQGVFLPDRGATGLTPTALKAAAGGAERTPVVQVGNVSALLDRLRKRDIWVVGLDPEGADLWGGFDWSMPVALVVGGEGSGLRRLVKQRCDALVGLPMPGGGGSLNLSVAAALAFYEVVRCRQGGSKARR